MTGLTIKGLMAVLEYRQLGVDLALQKSGPTPLHVRQAPKARKEIPARNRQQKVA